jgi:hypothetical protein
MYEERRFLRGRRRVRKLGGEGKATFVRCERKEERREM